jgi:hypothetical protein
MTDNQFWLRLWGYAACCLIALIGFVSIVSLHKDWQLANSQQPLELACAMSGSNATANPSCLVVASGK